MPAPRPTPSMNPNANDYDQTYLHAEHDGVDNSEVMMDFSAFDSEASARQEAAQMQDSDHGHMQHPEHMQHPGHLQGPAQMQDRGHMQDPSRMQDPSLEHGPSDTAAAAMAHYQNHTMTVPQSTEQAFMAPHKNDVELDNSVSMNQSMYEPPPETGEVQGPPAQPEPHGHEGSPSAQVNADGSKPAVGTDEWHKVRRDNHKEGQSLLRPYCT